MVKFSDKGKGYFGHPKGHSENAQGIRHRKRSASTSRKIPGALEPTSQRSKILKYYRETEYPEKEYALVKKLPSDASYSGVTHKGDPIYYSKKEGRTYYSPEGYGTPLFGNPSGRFYFTRRGGPYDYGSKR